LKFHRPVAIESKRLGASRNDSQSSDLPRRQLLKRLSGDHPRRQAGRKFDGPRRAAAEQIEPRSAIPLEQLPRCERLRTVEDLGEVVRLSEPLGGW
jgi:hypothetical protein